MHYFDPTQRFCCRAAGRPRGTDHHGGAKQTPIAELRPIPPRRLVHCVAIAQDPLSILTAIKRDQFGPASGSHL
jgi:hypothetical protein